MQDAITRITPRSQAHELYTPRPYVIEEEEEEAEEEDSSTYDTDDAAPSVNIPRYRGQTTDQSRKRSSMPPAITSAKTSIYRTANSIISQRTSISENQNGIQYRSQFESVPAAEKGWEMHTQFQRPMSIFSVTSGPRHSKAPSIMQPRIFQMLPREVFDCVLQQLEVLHFGKGAQSCTTCYLRDLYNLALTSRKWDKAARSKLYSSLWLPPPDHPETNLYLKSKIPSRLKLLRKTLRERGALAKLVLEIKASEMQQVFLQANYNEGQEILNDLASIVMACPNLERLVGFHAVYNHEFDRLNHALSTRPNLKERAWIVGKPINHGAGKLTQQQAFELYPGPTELFLHHHDVTAKLHTIFLHGKESGAMDFRSFIATFRNLPHLQNLHLSNFSAADFNDRTLAALPTTLTSLRLEALDGVTDKGLLRFSSSPAAANLTSFALIHQEIVDLLILISFFKFCTRLQRFAIVQDGSPGVSPDIPLFRPIFTSKTLHALHWDILMPGPATDEFAVSIAGGAFPALRRLRAPCDYDGQLQDLCRPRGCVVRPEDGYLVHHDHEVRESSNHRDSMSPREETGPGPFAKQRVEYTRNLAQARRRAQERIDARVAVNRSPGSSANSSIRGSSMRSVSCGTAASGIEIVVEEDGVVMDRFTFEHMGTHGSPIEYVLEPDVEGSVDAVIGVADLMLGGPARGVGGVSPRGFGGPGIREACTGPAGARGGTGKWWHRPRGRVRVVEVMDFF